jgi:type IV pilus assembly protein PilW
MSTNTMKTSRRSFSAGFSLVELMVSMVIGLILTLAITSVMTSGESTKRSATTLNDTNQTATHISFVLDRTLRSAGSGFVQSWSAAAGGGALGCLLNASRDGSAILPRPSAIAAPFASVPLNIRLAPVVIERGTDSDVLTVMSGSAGFAEVGRRVLPASVTTNSVRLINTLGWREDDLVLFSEDGTGCMLQQVRALVAGADQELPLGGRFFQAAGTTVNLSAFGSSNTFAIALGSINDAVPARHNPPQFQLFGVDTTTRRLVSYDLLLSGVNDAPAPIADGVTEMRALYGIDVNGDGILDSWQSPTGTFSSGSLLDGTPGAQSRLRQIVAVRVGLILQTSLIEKELVAPETLPLFGDLVDASLHMQRTLSADEQHIRHRTIEFTVPLRNMLLL